MLRYYSSQWSKRISNCCTMARALKVKMSRMYGCLVRARKSYYSCILLIHLQVRFTQPNLSGWNWKLVSLIKSAFGPSGSFVSLRGIDRMSLLYDLSFTTIAELLCVRLGSFGERSQPIINLFSNGAHCSLDAAPRFDWLRVMQACRSELWDLIYCCQGSRGKWIWVFGCGFVGNELCVRQNSSTLPIVCDFHLSCTFS